MSEQLKAFLADSARPAETLWYHELQGFLFAIACAPELVPPSGWMPEIFGGGDAVYASLEEANQILGQLMSLYNIVNDGVFAGTPALPADCAFRDDVAANLEPDAPVGQWARGFMQGHLWLEETWDAYLPDDLDEEFAAILLTLSFFASREVAEAFRKESAPGKTLDAVAVTIRRAFPGAMVEYAHLGRTIARMAAEEGARPVTRGPKTGRNEPCPCGSGRKYKKCCGAPA